MRAWAYPLIRIQRTAVVAVSAILCVLPILLGPCLLGLCFPEIANARASANFTSFYSFSPELQKEVRSFNDRLRAILAPADTIERAIRYVKLFELPDSETPFSKQSDAQILAYLKARGESAFSEIENPTRPRRARFTEAELQELVALEERKRGALETAQAQIFKEVDAQRKLLEEASHFSSRYDLLLALHDALALSEDERADLILGALSRAKLPRPVLTQEVVELIYPYAVAHLVPATGHEFDAPRPEESPIFAAEEAARNLSGRRDRVEKALSLYRTLRDQDPSEVALPARGTFPVAMPVAMIDTGIDFKRFPELAKFLGPGSWDFADGDAVPWSPYWEGYSHGTRTASTLVTVLKRIAPEALRPGQLELSMWKVFTVRETLSGGDDEGFHSWGVWPAAEEAVIREVEQGASAPFSAPKVVSVSMGFPLFQALKAIHRETLLRRAPWLWVMAAGNDQSTSLSENKRQPNCFDDVPSLMRDDSHILCIGAVTRDPARSPEGTPKLAWYSNSGSRVDVYSYESFDRSCTSGTSCAAPAVAASAAVIASRVPGISPEKIKRAILAASEAVPLTREGEFGSGPSTFQGKFFDPLTMTERAVQAAQKLR